MTENDVFESLKVCAEQKTCDGCSYRNDKTFCKENLMKDAYYVIKYQHEQIVQASEAIEKLTKDNDNLYAMVNRKYTDEQLVKALNEVVKSFGLYEMDEQIRTIGKFMNLCGLKGHIAVSTAADSIRIVLDK